MTTRPLCSITDCPNPVHARGWCQSHYNRWYREGGPTSVSVSLQRRTGPVRLPLSYVVPEMRAAAWAGQVRFDAAIVELCDHPNHVR